MKTVELSPVGGLEIQDIDLRKDLSPDEVEEIRHAFQESHLLLVREQEIDKQDQARFLSHLGKLAPSTGGPFSSVVDYVSTERYSSAGPDKLLFHIDRAFQTSVPYAISFYALKFSEGSSPTTFANAAAAYQRLPDTLKTKLDGLSIINMVDLSREYDVDDRRPRGANVNFDEVDPQRVPHATHPAVWRLPITNTPVLLVNEDQTSRFVGMDREESEQLYHELTGYLYAPDNVYWHYWRLGDLIVWNNAAIHHGRPYPEGTSVRELRRILVDTAA